MTRFLLLQRVFGFSGLKRQYLWDEGPTPVGLLSRDEGVGVTVEKRVPRSWKAFLGVC